MGTDMDADLPPAAHDDESRDAADRGRPEGTATSRTVDAARLVDQVVDYAILALDESGTIESWNTGAGRLTGHTAAQAIGRSFSMFSTEEDRHAGLPLALLDEARLKGRAAVRGWRLRKDGTRFWGDVVITSLHDDDGELGGFAKVVRDLTVEHELEESRRRSEERFRVLVSQVKDYAIIALDASGTIESWNVGAEWLKGYTAAEAVGRSLSMFYSVEDRRAGLPLRLLDEARTEGRVEHTGWRIRKDGTRFWGDVIITALHDDEGRLTGFANVTRDLTERKQDEEALSSFLGSLAHDFTAPVTAIKGFNAAIQEAPEDKRDDFHLRIDANADRLTQMMRDLVTYAAAHSTSVRRPETFDLAGLARTTVLAMGCASELDRVTLPGGRSFVRADKAAIERVLTNLVSNALKYSSTGPVVVDVARAADQVRLSVADQGRGIEPRDLGTIFDEFERGALATKDGGTGLGLTSVKTLVEAQGGSVHIESVVGQGTTVTVALPAPMRGPGTPSPPT
jgi:PAS domain S-box-containing protein